MEGQIGVHTPRGTSVATVRLDIPPDESKITPNVLMVIPREIQPGQLVSILGENFLTRERGRVTFRIGSRAIRATIIDWTTSAILAEMPNDVSGLQRTAMTVEVKNYLGRSDSLIQHAVTFIPIQVTEELKGVLHHLCNYRETWDERKTFFDFNLINDWRVVMRPIFQDKIAVMKV